MHKATVSRLLHSLVMAGLIERAKPLGFRSLTSLTQRRKLRIGYASQNEKAEFPARITESLKRAAQIHGAELLVFDNHFDRRTTLRNVNDMLRQRVSVAIVFSTIESIASAVAERVLSAKTPLIAVEMPIPGAVFYGANNYAAGWTAGVALGRFARRRWHCDLCHVVLIELPEAGALPQMRMAGAVDGIRDVIPSLRDRQIVHLDGRNDLDHSYSVTKRWLRTAPDGNCLIAAINDPGALGAIAAFQEARRSGEFVAAGQNATRAARLQMRKRNSPLIGSVTYQPERYGTELMRLAVHLSQGRAHPEAIYARHGFVTPANVDRLFPEDRALDEMIPVIPLPDSE
jgi:ribose transport system substrate-binding protein